MSAHTLLREILHLRVCCVMNLLLQVRVLLFVLWDVLEEQRWPLHLELTIP